MTLEEYTDRLSLLANEYAEKAADEIFVPAANELLATVKQRINDGENSAGSTIGTYSTTPAYYGQESFVRKSSFSAQGKTGEKVFKNGKPHKTEYFPSGYSGLRSKQGRRTDRMNMNYSGSTLLSYQMQVRDKDILLGMVNKEASEIRLGQEKKRGKIFYATQQEMDSYNRNVIEGVRVVTDRIMRNK